MRTIPARSTIVFATVLVYALAACSHVTSLQFNAVPLSEVRGNGELVRFDTFDGSRFEMSVETVAFPYVVGIDRGQRVCLDLRRVKAVAIATQQPDHAATSIKYWVIAAGSYAAVLVGLALIIVATKSFCPFFYVDDEGRLNLVGEAYSGAAFRSIARDDLLPMPLPAGLQVRARLANEAHETQLTDRLELVLADHPPDVRVLSTFDARAIAVGPSRPPTDARDQDGRDLESLVRTADDHLWQTDLAEMVARSAPPLRETLLLTFDRGPAVSPSGGAPVLELSVGNTLWIDAVMGRFFALMGARLEGYIQAGNDPSARAEIEAWREREGVDLRVEVELDGRFQPAAVIPTVGPMALRRVAVPLPAATARSGRPLHVRVSGGLGFWRIDDAALSWQVPFDAELRRVAPVSARDPAGRDWREALRSVDGTSQVLGDRGDRLDLSFELPPIPAGRRRTAFLFTHGYYNVHRPPEGNWSPLTLKTIRDRPGALAAFGLDLYRGYMRLVAGEGAR
jgi:hypothetical protein